jgi:hypothetical protein
MRNSSLPADDLEHRVSSLERQLDGLTDVVMLMLDREIELKERLGFPPKQGIEDVEHIKQVARRIRRERGLEPDRGKEV